MSEIMRESIVNIGARREVSEHQRLLQRILEPQVTRTIHVLTMR